MKIEEQRKILERATAFPWRVGGEDKDNVYQTKHVTRDVWMVAECFNKGEPDAKAIAMMRNHYSAMLDLCEVVQMLNNKDFHLPVVIRKALKRIESIGE